MGDPAVDLARLAAGYDHRLEVAADTRATLAAAAAGLGEGSVAVDVGGGRGRHAAVFAARGARAVLVDMSAEMARSAGDRGVFAVVGDGARLPVRDGIATLVYYHLSLHHGPAERWLAEAARVAAPGGLVWVWTLAPEHHHTSFLASWFPSVATLDEARFRRPDDLVGVMTRLGLADVSVAARVDAVERTAGSWTEAVRAGFVSTLHLVAPSEIDAGLAAFASAHPDPSEPIHYSLRYASVSGRWVGSPASPG